MKIVRFANEGKARYGLLDGDTVRCIKGSPFAGFKGSGGVPALDGSKYLLGDVRLLAPCRPSKIVCLGLNYRSHAEEYKLDIPKVPLLILKLSTAVIGPGDDIILPPNSIRVDYEGELGVVIGRKTKNVPLERAKDCVLGYTCFNDVSERINQAEDGQWTRAKSYDTFAPIGPCIETDVNPDDLNLEARLNDEIRQSARTGDLIFDVSTVISFISGVMTLLPGDVIATGTPSGSDALKPGDVVEITIGGIGTLRNTVAVPR